MKLILSTVVKKGDGAWRAYNPDGYIHAVGRDNEGYKTDYRKLSEEELTEIADEAAYFCDLVNEIF